MNKNYTVRYRLTIRGILTGDDIKVNAPTKYHAIELVRHLINIDCMQTHFDDVQLDCQVIDESEDPLTILMKNKYPLYCYNLMQLGMWDTSECCDSCHEEANDDLGASLLDRWLPDGRWIKVCCECNPWDATTHEALELS